MKTIPVRDPVERGGTPAERFAELAQAIAKSVRFDRLVLHLAGTRLEHGTVGPSPVATTIIPLFAGGALLGRLHVTRGGDPFTDEERTALAYLSPHLAVSAHSMAEATARLQLLDEAEALLEVGRATAALVEPREVVKRALEIVGRHLPFPTEFAVFGAQDDLARWRLLGARSPSVEKLAALEATQLAVVEVGDARASAMRAGETFFVADGQSDTGIVGALCVRFGVRALLTVPLRAADEILGAMFVCDPTSREFTPAETRLLRGIADQVAVSLRNARLASENLRAVEDLRALSRRLWTLQEEERARIARELHDDAGQAMTALKLNLDLARREADLERVRGRIADAVELAGAVLDELRRISQDLRPGGLHELGLVPALRALVEGFGARNAIDTEFVATAAVFPHPDSDAASTAFRFVQEALTNVARHAHARKVKVSLETAPAGLLRVCVQDDGVGFGPESRALEGHLGLLGMRERARMLGGSLTLESAAGKGARLSLEVPNDGPAG